MVLSNQIKIKLALYTALYLYEQNKNYRRYWIHPVNRRRKQMGEYYTIVKLISRYPEKYFNYFRMSKSHFDFIYSIISRKIQPSVKSFRKDSITAKEKLVLTLRFLATGCSFTDLSLRFLMGRSTVERCIYQTINAINKYLKPIALPIPTCNDWIRISNDFLTRWNFPNCLGAVDGKHIDTFAPNNSGSLNFNYKKRFSTVLMAVDDAEYKFVTVDIGAYGSNADSSIFKNSKFCKMWLNNPERLHIPNDTCLPGTLQNVPYVIVGDEAFSLQPSLLTPYSGKNLTQIRRIFNYRLSRARRIVENAFGILSSKWRVLLKRLEVKHHGTMKNIVLSCVILHNLVNTNVGHLEHSSTIDVHLRETDLTTINRLSLPASRGYDIREKFAEWCIKEGDVPFQYQLI